MASPPEACSRASSCVTGRAPSGSTTAWPASTNGANAPGGRRVTRTRAKPGSVLGVVDRGRVLHADGEAEAVDRRVVAHGTQAVHQVGRDVHEVTLLDLPLLPVDHHDPAPGGDVIELVGRVRVRIDEAAARNLELADQLEEATIS